MKFINLDDMHWSGNKLMSYNKAFNWVISAREAGKTTWTWLYAFRRCWEKGLTTIVLRRRIADITNTYIEDISNTINKFIDEPIEFVYKKGMTDGIADILVKRINDDEPPRPFFRVIALSNPLSRIKSLNYPNLGLMIYDEVICNTRMGEKYLDSEVFRFNEVYTTFRREASGILRCIFMGNPYALYNPFFSTWDVPVRNLSPGNFVVGKNYCIDVYQITEKLKQHILSVNPLYEFDDSYTKYAFDGTAINDQQINVIPVQPNNFKLTNIFYMHNKKLGVYRPTGTIEDLSYWLAILPKDYDTKNRTMICFDINDLINGSKMLASNFKVNFSYLKDCIGRRRVGYKSIEEGYMAEELYQCL